MILMNEGANVPNRVQHIFRATVAVLLMISQTGCGTYMPAVLSGKENPRDDSTDLRDVHHIWQWMITNAELEAVMKELGYRKPYFADFGAFGDLKTL
ncbi:MAG: hypothetical protein ACI9UQ_000651 [Candidatus Krumholzibacteriia bacterium]|jgi:hypothetical protein